MNALWFEASPRRERYAINALTAEEAGDVADEISAGAMSKAGSVKTRHTYEW